MLSIAADRLYETGWCPEPDEDVDMLPDGRVIPSVLSVQRAFTSAGLELSIKHNLVFDCYRAEWVSVHHPGSPDAVPPGTVVGKTEREAAVFALAQLRANESLRVDPDAAEWPDPANVP